MLDPSSSSSSSSNHLIKHQQNHHPPPPSIYFHQLLSACAHSISISDFPAARRIATLLSSTSSPSGDSPERLTHYFTQALLLRIHPTPKTYFSDHFHDAILQQSHLTLNQITPFIRFTHLTANQAILESINQSNHVHILDFDIMHGVQWPPLMQSIASTNPPPSLRITAFGTSLDPLRRTGDRLSKFAHSLGLKFRFFPLLIPCYQTLDDIIKKVVLFPNETLAVNLVHYLHRLLIDRDGLILLLKKIRSLNPKVVTLAENEANHNQATFLARFDEALKYYAAIFDSLEVTVAPNSGERMAVERVWFWREIMDIVVAEGEDRRERHEKFLTWKMMMKIAGFRSVGLSPFAVSQAKLLLRLHYILRKGMILR